MIRQKRKITRREIKEDTLVTLYYNALSYFENYKQQMIYGLGGVAVIALISFFYISNKSTSNEEANAALARVMALYDSGVFQEAIDGRPGTKIIGLKKIVEEYSGTENGETARIYLANCYFNLGKIEEANEQFDAYSGNNELLQAAAYAGIAGYYEAKNNFEEAASYFKKAASVNDANVLNPQYLMFASINLIQVGEKNEAKEILTTLKRDFSKSSYVRDVDRYLTQVQ